MKVSPAAEKTLALIAAHGPAERIWYDKRHGHAYSWRVGGKPCTQTVQTLYSKGLIGPPANGDPGILALTAHGRRYLEALPVSRIAPRKAA